MRHFTLLVICLALTSFNSYVQSQGNMNVIHQGELYESSPIDSASIFDLFVRKIDNSTIGYYFSSPYPTNTSFEPVQRTNISAYFDVDSDAAGREAEQCSFYEGGTKISAPVITAVIDDEAHDRVYFLGANFYELDTSSSNCDITSFAVGDSGDFTPITFTNGYITDTNEMVLFTTQTDDMYVFDLDSFRAAPDATAKTVILETGKKSPILPSVTSISKLMTVTLEGVDAVLAFAVNGKIYLVDPSGDDNTVLTSYIDLPGFEYSCTDFDTNKTTIYFTGYKPFTLTPGAPLPPSDGSTPSEFTFYLVAIDIIDLVANDPQKHDSSSNFFSEHVRYTVIGGNDDVCRGMSGDWQGGQLLVNFAHEPHSYPTLNRYSTYSLSPVDPAALFGVVALYPGPVYFELQNNESTYGNRLVVASVKNEIFSFSLLSGCPMDCGEFEMNGSDPNPFGHCWGGQCECIEGKSGETCYEIECSPGCGSFGTCDTTIGICICDSDHIGEVCDERRCPNDCNGENGVCNTASNYTCECTNIWGGDDCSVRAYEICDTFTTEKICTSKYGCGWGRKDKVCERGDGNGPIFGARIGWQYGQNFEVGLLIVAIIMIVIFILMTLNNIVSAVSVDYRTAGVIEDNENLLTTSFLKEAYWRDERSSKSWALYEQFQFISFYALLNVTFTSRIVQFTSYFNWALFNLPLPFYDNTKEYPYRDPSRIVLNADQYANGLGLDREQIYYSTMFWFLIAVIIFLVLYGIYALIAYLALKSRQEKIGRVLFQKLFYIISRLIIAGQLPITIVSAYHIRGGHSSNKGTIAAAVITLIIFGILPIVFNAFIVRKQDKNLLYLYLKLRYGAFYSVYHYKKARFGVLVMIKRFLVGCLVGFLIASVESQDKYIIPQAIIVLLIYVAYIVVLVIFRPYLDSFHFLLDIVLALLNAITIGIAILHKSGPSSTGEIVAACCVLLSFFVCIIAYIHSWTRIKGNATYICCMFKDVPQNPGEAELEEKKGKKPSIETDDEKSSSELDSSVISDSEKESSEEQKEDSDDGEEEEEENDDDEEEDNDESDEISADSVEDSSE